MCTNTGLHIGSLQINRAMLMFFTHDKSACKHRTWVPENLHTGRNFHQLIFQWPKVLFQSTKAHFLHSTFWKFPFMLHSPLIKYINIIFLQCRYIYTFLGDALCVFILTLKTLQLQHLQFCGLLEGTEMEIVESSGGITHLLSPS